MLITDNINNINSEMKSQAEIVGIGLRLPGNIFNLCTLAETLENKRSCLKSTRWKNGLYGMNHQCGKIDVASISQSKYTLPLAEVTELNPMISSLIEVVTESILDSGLKLFEVSEVTTGLYMGITFCDTDCLVTSDSNSNCLNTRSQLTNLLANHFDLHGPVIQFDGACASSFAALQAAVLDLKARRCDLAIVAGSNLVLDPTVSLQFAKMNMLSPTGQSCPFDADANGYVRSEGIAALILQLPDKRISRRYYCDVVGYDLRSEGTKAEGIIHPCVLSQSEMLGHVYEKFEIDMNLIDFYEAHGTSTQKGDLVELTAISEAICSKRAQPLYIGSIKGNIGHTEATAGIAGILKCVASMLFGKVYPNINFHKPNPNIPALKSDKLFVQTDVDYLSLDTPTITSVSSFGFGGLIGHVVLHRNNRHIKSSCHNQLMVPLSLPAPTKSPEDLIRLYKHLPCERFQRFLLSSELCHSNAFRSFIICNFKKECPEFLERTAQVTKTEEIYLRVYFSDFVNHPISPSLDVLEIPTLKHMMKNLGYDFQTVPSLYENRGLEFRLICQMALADMLREAGVDFRVSGEGVGYIAAAYVDGCIQARQALQLAKVLQRFITEFSQSFDDAIEDITPKKVHEFLDSYQRIVSLIIPTPLPLSNNFITKSKHYKYVLCDAEFIIINVFSSYTKRSTSLSYPTYNEITYSSHQSKDRDVSSEQFTLKEKSVDKYDQPLQVETKHNQTKSYVSNNQTADNKENKNLPEIEIRAFFPTEEVCHDNDSATCTCSNFVLLSPSKLGFLSALGHAHLFGQAVKAEIQLPTISAELAYDGDFTVTDLWRWQQTSFLKEPDWKQKKNTGKLKSDSYIELEMKDIETSSSMPCEFSLVLALYTTLSTLLKEDLAAGMSVVTSNLVIVFHEEEDTATLQGKLLKGSKKFCVGQVGQMTLTGSYEVQNEFKCIPETDMVVLRNIKIQSPKEMLKEIVDLFTEWIPLAELYRFVYDPASHITAQASAAIKSFIPLCLNKSNGYFSCGGFIFQFVSTPERFSKIHSEMEEYDIRKEAVTDIPSTSWMEQATRLQLWEQSLLSQDDAASKKVRFTDEESSLQTSSPHSTSPVDYLSGSSFSDDTLWSSMSSSDSEKIGTLPRFESNNNIEMAYRPQVYKKIKSLTEFMFNDGFIQIVKNKISDIQGSFCWFAFILPMHKLLMLADFVACIFRNTETGENVRVLFHDLKTNSVQNVDLLNFEGLCAESLKKENYSVSLLNIATNAFEDIVFLKMWERFIFRLEYFFCDSLLHDTSGENTQENQEIEPLKKWFTFDLDKTFDDTFFSLVQSKKHVVAFLMEQVNRYEKFKCDEKVHKLNIIDSLVFSESHKLKFLLSARIEKYNFNNPDIFLYSQTEQVVTHYPSPYGIFDDLNKTIPNFAETYRIVAFKFDAGRESFESMLFSFFGRQLVDILIMFEGRNMNKGLVEQKNKKLFHSNGFDTHNETETFDHDAYLTIVDRNFPKTCSDDGIHQEIAHRSLDLLNYFEKEARGKMKDVECTQNGSENGVLDNCPKVSNTLDLSSDELSSCGSQIKSSPGSSSLSSPVSSKHVYPGDKLTFINPPVGDVKSTLVCSFGVNTIEKTNQLLPGCLLLYLSSKNESKYLGLLFNNDGEFIHRRFTVYREFEFEHLKNVVNVMIGLFMFCHLTPYGTVRASQRNIVIQPPLFHDNVVFMMVAEQLGIGSIYTGSSLYQVRENVESFVSGAHVLKSPLKNIDLRYKLNGKGCDMAIMFRQNDVEEHLSMLAHNGHLVLACSNTPCQETIGLHHFLKNISLHSLNGLEAVKHFMLVTEEKQVIEFEENFCKILSNITYRIKQEFPGTENRHLFSFARWMNDVKMDLLAEDLVDAACGGQSVTIDWTYGRVLVNAAHSKTMTEAKTEFALNGGNVTNEKTNMWNGEAVNGIDATVANKRVEIISLSNLIHSNIRDNDVTLLQAKQFKSDSKADYFVSQKTDSPIVKLNNVKQGLPLFIVHPILGDVTCLKDLASRLSFPVVGIQYTNQASISGISGMARYYLACIENYICDKKYLLGGYSFGSVVAHEMACKANNVVGLVCLDGSPQYVHAHIQTDVGNLPTDCQRKHKLSCAILVSFVRLFVPNINCKHLAFVLSQQNTREDAIKISVDLSLNLVQLSVRPDVKQKWRLSSSLALQQHRLASFRKSLLSSRAASISCKDCRSSVSSLLRSYSCVLKDGLDTSFSLEEDVFTEMKATGIKSAHTLELLPSRGSCSSECCKEMETSIPELFMSHPACSVSDVFDKLLYSLRKQKAERFLSLALLVMDHVPIKLQSVPVWLVRVKSAPKFMDTSLLDEDYGLKAVVENDKLQILFVDGDHYTFLQPPHNKQLVAHLQHINKSFHLH